MNHDLKPENHDLRPEIMILNMMILCKSKITDLHPKPKDCSV